MTLTDRKTSNISVIIPVYNEEKNIARTIQSVGHQPGIEVLVIDGGSSDRTHEIALSCGAQMLSSELGRAKQMNRGAAAATGDILLFLHGDSILPNNFAKQLHTTLQKHGTIAGAFRLAIGLPGIGVRIIEFTANLRSKILQMPYGDQAIFMKRSVFKKMGGFPDFPILEEVILMRKLARKGRISIAASAITTSGRRWRQQGILKTTFLNQIIVLGYLLGVSPKRLQDWYRVRKKA